MNTVLASVALGAESYAYNAAGYRTSVTNGRGKTRTYTYTDRGEVASLTLPDSSVEAWSYNGNGQTSAYTNPLSQVIYYTFDDAGRQTGIDYPTGTDVAFSYDYADRRTGMSDSTGSTGWTYNAASELTAFSSPQGNLSYTYTSAGQRATMVDGSLTTTYTYDDAGRLTSLQNGYSETTSFVYDNANRLTQQTFHSGAKSIFGYDSRGRQTSVDHKTSSNAVLSEEDYVYDYAGNLTSKTVDSVTTTYTYDDIDQLLTESRTGYSASYTYDANGNRASKTLNGTTEVYTNDDADKLTEIKVSGVTVKSFGYDGAGRTTSVVTGAGTTTVAYDYEGRISQITYPSTATNTFAYNGLDTRVSKVDSAGTATYKRDGAHVTAPVISDGSAVYTPGISERRSSTTKYYGSDRLGTNALETNSSQAVTATKTYDAFGMPVATTGSSASPFGFAGQHGYQEDADSGLKLLGHRYYDASTGRFLTRDPIKDGRNWYGYCEGNPVSNIDDDGNQVRPIRPPITWSPNTGRGSGGRGSGRGSPGAGGHRVPPNRSIVPYRPLRYSDPPSPVWPFRPHPIPGHWSARPSDRGGGIIYTDPKNPENFIRIMPGNPSASYPEAREPYVRIHVPGGYRNNNGGIGGRRDQDTHIRLKDYGKWATWTNPREIRGP